MGSIECRRSSTTVATLIGRTQQGERAYLTLTTAAPVGLPERIDEGAAELLDGTLPEDHRCRLSTPGTEWMIVVRKAFVHYDASGAFFAALPPRRVPLAKRAFWRLALAAAATRAGRHWLAH